MKYCSKCILSENIFSVTINDDGLCNYCVSQPQTISCNESYEIDLSKYKRGTEHDIILAYSGGKDSTYTLCLLKEKYNLNVLAVTFDNGFLADETYKNIKNVCSNLSVNNLIISPSIKKLNSIFKYADKDELLPKKSLERASAICTYCIGLVKMNVYKEAILREIPLIAFGWTPGQINMNKKVVKLDYKIVKSNFARMKGNIIKEFGESYNSILLADDVLDKCKDNIPSLFYPFSNDNYSEKQVIDKIHSIGWKKPNNTDGNSTNCLLNAYAIHRHKKKYEFHPYALELAYLVRNNLMDREEALSRIVQDEDAQLIEYVEKKLNRIDEGEAIIF
ncbi:conserved hypothetical protein [Gammaproteobacteria bacterium]